MSFYNTRYIARINWKKSELKQITSAILHSMRIRISSNIERNKIKNNVYEILNHQNFYKKNQVEYKEFNNFKNKNYKDKVDTKNENLIIEKEYLMEKFNELKQLMIIPFTEIEEQELLNDFLNTDMKIRFSRAKRMIKKIFDDMEREMLKQNEVIEHNDEYISISKKIKLERRQFQTIKERLSSKILKLNEKLNINEISLTEEEKKVDLSNFSLKGFDEYYFKMINKNIKIFDKKTEEEKIKIDEQVAEKFINKYWHIVGKIYKESMREGQKKNMIGSLSKFGAKHRIVKKLKEERKEKCVKGLNNKHTLIQELVFKPATKGFQMNTLELQTLRNKIVKEEKDKGNIVLFSAIHQDESSPHIHIFITSKDFKINQNQVNYFNKMNNTTFAETKRDIKENKEYGKLSQKNWLEMLNDSLIDNDRKFVLKHIKVFEDIKKQDFEKMENMTEEEIEEIKENLNQNRIIENKRISGVKRIQKLTISQSLYNNYNLKEEEYKKLIQSNIEMERRLLRKQKEIADLESKIKDKTSQNTELNKLILSLKEEISKHKNIIVKFNKNKEKADNHIQGQEQNIAINEAQLKLINSNMKELINKIAREVKKEINKPEFEDIFEKAERALSDIKDRRIFLSKLKNEWQQDKQRIALKIAEQFLLDNETSEILSQLFDLDGDGILKNDIYIKLINENIASQIIKNKFKHTVMTETNEIQETPTIINSEDIKI